MSVCLSVSNSERPLSLIVRLWKDFSEGSRFVMSLQSSCWPGLQFSCEISTGQESASKFTHVVVRTQFLMGWWAEVFSFALAVGQKPSSVSCYMGFSREQITVWQLTFLRVSQRAGESCQEGSHGLLATLVSEVTSHHSVIFYSLEESQ